MFEKIANLLNEPPPGTIFELSEGGIAYARIDEGEPQFGFQPVAPETMVISPLSDNVKQPELFGSLVDSLIPAQGGRRGRPAVLILPDFAGRLSVIDFDTLPGSQEERQALIRFRMKKSVPFDIDSAAISFHVQPSHNGSKKLDVIVSVMSLEIIARYESPFRAAGYHPGIVTTSGIAALGLLKETSAISVVAKLSGKALTVMVLNGQALKLARCVEIPELTSEELMDVLQPTLAFIEDELAERPARLVLCGFGPFGDQWGPVWSQELRIPVEPMRSRFGTPGPANAGLLGYLEGI